MGWLGVGRVSNQSRAHHGLNEPGGRHGGRAAHTAHLREAVGSLYA